MALSHQPWQAASSLYWVEKTAESTGANTSCRGAMHCLVWAYKNKMVTASSQPKRPVASSQPINQGAGESNQCYTTVNGTAGF